MKTRRIVTCAMLIALHVVLGLFVSVNLGNIKLTFDALPIIVAALLFGPTDGMLVGLLGSFMLQLVTYGLTPTTVLWIIPPAVRGLMVGAWGSRIDITNRGSLLTVVAVSSAVVTTLNTASMAADALFYGYFSYPYVFGTLVVRYISGFVTAVLYCTITPEIVANLESAGIGNRKK